MASSRMGPHNGNVVPPQKLHICIQNWPIYRLNLDSHRSWLRAFPQMASSQMGPPQWQCSATTCVWHHMNTPQLWTTPSSDSTTSTFHAKLGSFGGGYWVKERGHRTLQSNQLSLTMWTCCLMWILAFTSMTIPKPNVPIATRSTKWKKHCGRGRRVVVI